jgi:hypothetical protein
MLPDPEPGSPAWCGYHWLVTLTDTALPPATIEVAVALGTGVLTKGLVLGGGTGIALRLAHRRSRDLDQLLTRRGGDRIATDALLAELRTTFGDSSVVTTLRSSTQLDCQVRGVRLSWIGYPFELVDEPSPWHGLRVASLLDAAAMKAYTLGRRIAARDYIDLYAIFRSGVTVGSVIERAQEIFVLEGSHVFDGHLFAKQLTCAEDCEDVDEAMSDVVDGSLVWETVEQSLTDSALEWERTLGVGR